MHLLKGMDNLKREMDRGGLMEAMDSFGQRAFGMLTTPQVREAFDLSKEFAKPANATATAPTASAV